MRAIYNNVTIAESDETVVVEGNHYFPPDSVRQEYLQPSAKHTGCPWKGTASYYTVTVDGQSSRDAAWYYPEPKSAAAEIKGRVAFWRGVKVIADDREIPAASAHTPPERRTLLSRIGLR